MRDGIISLSGERYRRVTCKDIHMSSLAPGGLLLKLLFKCINRSRKRLSVYKQDTAVGTVLERLPHNGGRVVTIQELVHGKPNPPGLSRARHASQQGLSCRL